MADSLDVGDGWYTRHAALIQSALAEAINAALDSDTDDVLGCIIDRLEARRQQTARGYLHGA